MTFWHRLGTIGVMGGTPYPETEPLFESGDPELETLRRGWDATDGRDLRHQAQRGWGDTSVCLGPDGPTDLPWEKEVASRSPT